MPRVTRSILAALVTVTLAAPSAAPLVAQEIDAPGREPLVQEAAPDSAVERPRSPTVPHFWTANAELLLIQAIPWAWSRYVRRGDWSGISPGSWWRNLREGFEWDEDGFQNNQFAHPYHGSLYFNAARTNGYGFWSSVPFVALGSLTWEYFGETHRPAINDWINTTLGGIALGEATYRLSSMILDERLTGSERVRREIWAALVNPVRGFNRLIRGDVSRVGANPFDRDPTRFGVTLDMGYRRVLDGRGAPDPLQVDQLLLRFLIRYGDQFDRPSTGAFEAFEISGELATANPGALARLESRGTLTATSRGDTTGLQHGLGVHLHYEYLANPAFEYGAKGVSLTRALQLPLGRHRGRAELEIGAIPLGATPSDYAQQVVNRSYDYGAGLWGRVGTRITRGSLDVLDVSYQRTWIHTLDGAGSDHRLTRFNAQGRVPLTPGLAAGAAVSRYHRSSTYVDHDPVRRATGFVRLFLSTRSG